MRHRKWIAAGVVLLGVVLAIGASVSPPLGGFGIFAAEPDKFGEPEKRTGKVESFLKNDHDDIDGLKLGDGTITKFPPHVGREVSKLIKVGDEIQVDGRTKTKPRGEVEFEATRIAVGDQAIDVPPPPVKGKGKDKGKDKGKGHEPAMNAQGVVAELKTNPKGDTDGLLLKDGVEVKFPPHQGQALRELVKVGDEVRVAGRRHETPKGDVHLHADRIVATASGKAIERDGPPHGKHGPPHGKHDPAASSSGVTNEEILAEIRALRKLIEERK